MAVMQISHKYTYILFLLSLSPNPPFPPAQVITEHQAGFPVLYSNFPLAIFSTHDSVYRSVLLPPFIPLSPPLPKWMKIEERCNFLHIMHVAFWKNHYLPCKFMVKKKKKLKYFNCRVRVTVFSIFYFCVRKSPVFP